MMKCTVDFDFLFDMLFLNGSMGTAGRENDEEEDFDRVWNEP